VDLAEALALRLTDALNAVLADLPALPLPALAAALRAKAGSAPSPAVADVTPTPTLKPAISDYLATSGIVLAIDSIVKELKPRLLASGTTDDEAQLVADAASLLEKSGGDVVYADALKLHFIAALNEILTKQPDDPFKAIQKVLFAASLTDDDPPTAPAVTQTPPMVEYMGKYDLQTHIDACIAKKASGSGPKSGVKFLVSDAGDYFTELSKKLKAGGGVPMTAEELKAMDAAAAKAKREKEAKEQAERDAKDAENAEKQAAMEAEGKKVSGGLHKFDASEVDIHGGAGTADDFLDAFGF